ncbi:hypothetical protein [Sphingobium sp. CAP-1]|uniref:hypothetical protein n=1 Tax=Sphingobium sp. CAP-1 TaxID=2676077 RepID=UPI0012BB247D|nr:hypothetical protein [Sphingobium sp. CAP-1]QGP80000.1 hypothetical protein GL174_14165 [Sphingobium sp. CAP-1]
MMPLSAAERSRRYRAKNLEKVRACGREYDRKRGSSERCKAWRDADPGKRLAYNASRLDAHSQQEQKRKAAMRAATPSWAEHDEMAEMYRQAQELELEVDHIVPILSPFVCGLHCLANMRLAGEIENKSKGNRHWPDMFEETCHL